MAFVSARTVSSELMLAELRRESVRPELAEGLLFFPFQREGQGFDKLSPNGY